MIRDIPNNPLINYKL